MMWKVLNADIASWFFSPWSFDLRKEWFTWKIIPVSTEIFTKWLRHIKLKFSFLLSTKFLKEYDVVLFSWDCISAVRNCKKDSKKIYYCHTPPRYIYDLHDLYLAKVPFYLKAIFKLACKIFRYLYERDLSKMDLILTNSINTQKRIKEFTWYDSSILYPPVDTSRFVWLWQKWYFLSFSRLADAKRVDKIVSAFRELPNEELVVIYWKNDPQKDKIFELSDGYSNIKVITLEDNDELYSYVWNARATIYLPIDEDFGMIPIESMSAGKPVIWVNEWGLKETIIHDTTWFLISPDLKKSDIISAVNHMTLDVCESMKENCEKRAKEFSVEVFSKQLQWFVT